MSALELEDVMQNERVKENADGTLTVTLLSPVTFGKAGEPVTEVTLKPNGRAMRDFEQKFILDGDRTAVAFNAYEYSRIGLRLAGVAGDKAFLDQMHPADLTTLGMVVLGFTTRGPKAGKTPSP